MVINYKAPSIGPLLGVKKRKSDGEARFLEANKWHVSNDIVNIIKVNAMQVQCNIFHGSLRLGIDDPEQDLYTLPCQSGLYIEGRHTKMDRTNVDDTLSR